MIYTFTATDPKRSNETTTVIIAADHLAQAGGMLTKHLTAIGRTDLDRSMFTRKPHPPRSSINTFRGIVSSTVYTATELVETVSE